MTAPRKIAVTGATGFVGGFVIEAALQAGCQVRALVRSPSKIKRRHDNLEWFQGSLGSDDEAFLDNMDVVIHLAGLIKARSREDYMRVNAKAAENLARAAKSQTVKRFVLISSQAATLPKLSDYAASKFEGENLVRDIFQDDLAVIQAPAVFGPGDDATKPFFDMMSRGFLAVPGGGDWKQRRISMVYAPDLARHIVETAIYGASGGEASVIPANIADVTWPEFTQLCEQALDRNIRLIPIPLALLYPVAAVTSLTSYLFGIGHLTRGKLREFMHSDWSTDTLIKNATAPIDAIRETHKSYAQHER